MRPPPCIQRNHVYLCEHHQVLCTYLEGSCLGSLYLRPLQFTWTFNPLLLPSEIMQGAAHTDDELNEIKDEIETVKNVTLQQGDFPDVATYTLSQISHFSVLFWFSFSLGVLTIGLLTCWYCGSRRQRQSARQCPDVMELPRTISEILDLNLDNNGHRRKAPTASAPPYSA